MHKEMDEVHDLQAKTGQRHKKAFEQLQTELEEAKKMLSEYAETHVTTLRGRADVFDEEQKGTEGRVLGLLRKRVDQLTARLEQVKEERDVELAAQKEVTKSIESALIKSDKEILDSLSALHAQENSLSVQQNEHYSELGARIESLAHTERADVKDAMGQQDQGLQSLSGALSAGLEASRRFIDETVSQGLAALEGRVRAERGAEEKRFSELVHDMQRTNESARLEDSARAGELQKLKVEFEKVSTELARQIQSIAARADTSSHQLRADREDLMGRIDNGRNSLLSRLDGGLAHLENTTDYVSDVQKTRIAKLSLALARFGEGVSAFGNAKDGAQLIWDAQKYNFQGDVHREVGQRETSLLKRAGSELEGMLAAVDETMGRSDEQLHALEVYSEIQSLATNATIVSALEVCACFSVLLFLCLGLLITSARILCSKQRQDSHLRCSACDEQLQYALQSYSESVISTTNAMSSCTMRVDLHCG